MFLERGVVKTDWCLVNFFCTLSFRDLFEVPGQNDISNSRSILTFIKVSIYIYRVSGKKKRNAVSRSKIAFLFIQHLFSFMKAFVFQFYIKSD